MKAQGFVALTESLREPFIRFFRDPNNWLGEELPSSEQIDAVWQEWMARPPEWRQGVLERIFHNHRLIMWGGVEALEMIYEKSFSDQHSLEEALAVLLECLPGRVSMKKWRIHQSVLRLLLSAILIPATREEERAEEALPDVREVFDERTRNLMRRLGCQNLESVPSIWYLLPLTMQCGPVACRQVKRVLEEYGFRSKLALKPLE